MKTIPRFSILAMIVCSAAFGQSAILGENVNIFDTTGGYVQNFLSDTLYIGAPFLRDTTKPLVVWFTGSTASWTGNLYLMKKDGSRIQLMSNHPGQCGTATLTRFDLTDSVRGIIHHKDTVTFMFQTLYDGSCTSFIMNPRYTGPNRSPLDRNPDGSIKWFYYDRFWTNEYATRPPDYGNNNYEVGRRYCVAGWIQKYDPAKCRRVRTDTAELVFEDGGDISFNDVRYKATGLFIMRPLVDTMILSATPNGSIIPTGDSIVFSLSLKGHDSAGGIITYPVDTVKKYVAWQLTRNFTHSLNPDLTTQTSTSFTNVFFTFHATEAYQTFNVTITFTKGTQLQTVQRSIRVIPGPVHHLVIEADTAGKPAGLVDTRPTVNGDQPAGTLHIPVNQTTTSAFAVLRDRYGNFVRFSTLTLWTVYLNDNVARVANGRTTCGEGIFTKMGPVDTAWARVLDGDSAASANSALFIDTVMVIVDDLPTGVQTPMPNNSPRKNTLSRITGSRYGISLAPGSSMKIYTLSGRQAFRSGNGTALVNRGVLLTDVRSSSGKQIKRIIIP